MVKLALTSPYFDSEPIYYDGSDIVLDADGKRVDTEGEGEGAGVFLLYTSPIVYTFTNLTTGKVMENYETEVKLASIIYLADIANIQINSAMAFGCSMEEIYPTLVLVTPTGDPSAHTTIYDLDYRLVMASSGLPIDQGQYNTYGGNSTRTPTLYVAGETPSKSVNDAFFESMVMYQPAGGIPRVDFEDNAADRVISSVVFQLPQSGNVYGIVQSTSRSFYFDSVVRLRTVMVILGVLCCALVVCACTAVALLIHQGIEQLLLNMEIAAQMKNDRTTFITTPLHDIDRLAKGFGKMNDKLLEARAYLPQHMLLSSSSGEEEGDEEGDANVSRNGRSVAASNIRSSGSVVSDASSRNDRRPETSTIIRLSPSQTPTQRLLMT